MTPAHEHNRRVWDERARRRTTHTEPAGDREFHDPLAAVDDCGWLGGHVAGRRVLCLAAGGGKHSGLFAALGAQVTVVDLSPRMLEQDRRVAAERGLRVTTVEASMDRLPMLGDASFDIVIQPVSTCYVSDILAVYREVARVTSTGGLYISQHKQPASLQAEAVGSARGYLVNEPCYRTSPLPPALDGLAHREAGTIEFLHRWEELVGGLCRSGFVVEDLIEPRHADPAAEPGSFAHRSCYLPPFVTLKARRKGESVPARIWTPGDLGR